MRDLIFLIPVILAITLVVSIVKIAARRMPLKETPASDFTPVAASSPILPSGASYALPPHYDTVFWAACLDAVQNQRAALDEEKLLILLELAREIKSREMSLGEIEESSLRNVLLYSSASNVAETPRAPVLNLASAGNA